MTGWMGQLVARGERLGRVSLSMDFMIRRAYPIVSMAIMRASGVER